MAITIKHSQPNKELQGTQLVRGKAYRLVHDGITGATNYIGNVYLCAIANLVNLNSGLVRDCVAQDIYIEVDLEIIVKERT